MRKLGSISLLVILICLGCIVALALVFLSQNRVVANQFPLRQKWVFEADARITATPVVHKDKILFRTPDRLYVVHASNGDLAWTFSLPMDKHADPPLIQDDYVILTHLEGITALNLATGEIVWEVYREDTRVDAVPVVANKEKVVVVDESILVLNLKTGALLWEIQNPYARSDAIVELHENNLYVVFEDQIRNYDFETGELRWQSNTQEWSLQNGIVDDNILYLERLEEGIAAYDLTEREILWQRTDLFLTDYPPTKYDDVLFVGSRGGVPVAIDALTGDTLWEAEGLWSYDNYQTPLVFDNVVYIRGLFQKKIYALNIDNGKVIGDIRLGIPDIVSSNASYSLGPVQAGEMIVFPAGSTLLAYGE